MGNPIEKHIVPNFKGKKMEYIIGRNITNLEKPKFLLSVLLSDDISGFGGALFFKGVKVSAKMGNRVQSSIIHAFHKPILNTGISDIAFLLFINIFLFCISIKD